MKEPPKVTGLSPKEGPPGTKITIRGENLGISQSDLISLSICGIECVIYADWLSPQKIITRSGRCKGFGDVIVTTKSAGRGTCTVQFRGYEEIIGPTKESAVWVNEDISVGMRHRSASPSSLLYPTDPLGLCTDDDSPQRNRAKLSEAMFREFFPEASDSVQSYGNISSEHFIPAWYLLENHSGTSFNDIKRGLMSLRMKVNGQQTPSATSGRMTFLKTNVLPVIECLDALKSLHLALKKDKQEMGFDLTAKVDECIHKATDEAHAIFDGVLARKDMVDSTRNALNVLQRYRFLFNLPSNIERSIQKGDYDVVINDYSRAKSLFADTQVKVFRKVYTEVEQRIEKFRVMLQEKLKTNCSKGDCNIDEVKKLLRYLISMDVPGNPPWDSIHRIKDTLLSSMIKCRDKHMTLMNKPIVESEVLDDDDDVNYAVEAPQPVQFIEELSLLFNQIFADLFKLGHSYLNGELYTKETEEQLRSKEEIFENEMVINPINNLCNQMRAALLPNSVKNVPNIKLWSFEIDENFVVWLPYCLRCVINCVNQLSKLELNSSANVNVLKSLQNFIFDLRIHTMTCLFNHSAQEIKNLHLKENWDIQLDDIIGARTQLPLLFESKVVESLQLVRETVLQTRNADESDIFSAINVQGTMKQLAQSLLASFIVALEKTETTPINSPTLTQKPNFIVEDRTLIVLCNCTFTYSHVIPRLYESFEKYGYPDMRHVIKITQSKYHDFENKLFEKYIERKCDLVIGTIEPSMYLFGNEWFSSDKTPIDVSYFIKETLMNLIEIQSEVYQIAPPLVNKVMRFIIDAALEEIQRLYESFASKLTEAALIQAFIDIGALHYAFDHSGEYISNSSKRILNECRKCLNANDALLKNQLIDNVLNKFKQSMQLQLNCFIYESDSTIMTL